MTSVTVRQWLREPLLLFLLIGAVLFAVEHGLAGLRPQPDALNRIFVSATQQQVLTEAFRAEQGRAPSREELQARLDRWIEEQVLYREALARGLDRRDAIVQRQLSQKMRFLLDDSRLLPEPGAAELQAWLERHPERYGQGRRVSFEQVFLSRGRHGTGLDAEAQRVAAQLARAADAFVGLGDPFLVGQVVQAADDARLRREFGPGFAEALAALPAGRWSAPVASPFGLHLLRVTARTAFRPARLEEVAAEVRADYLQAERERLNRAAYERLRAQYRVEYEDLQEPAG